MAHARHSASRIDFENISLDAPSEKPPNIRLYFPRHDRRTTVNDGIQEFDHITLADFINTAISPCGQEIGFQGARDLIDGFVFGLIASEPLLNNVLEQHGRDFAGVCRIRTLGKGFPCLAPCFVCVSKGNSRPSANRLPSKLSVDAIENLEGLGTTVADPQSKPWIAQIEDFDLPCCRWLKSLDGCVGQMAFQSVYLYNNR